MKREYCRRAWVFLCAAPSCTAKAISFERLQRDAFEAARKADWQLVYGMAYCPHHHDYRETITETIAFPEPLM